jgi:hypothetical protein
LLSPSQPEALGGIEIEANRISGEDNFYDRAARRLKQDGLLIKEWSPDILRMELDRYIWGEDKGWQVGLKRLWEYLAQYCYLPRLFDEQVLVAAVRSGVGRLDAPFAYATGTSPEGHHTGLLFRRHGQVFFDDQSILIHPDHVVEPAPPKETDRPIPPTPEPGPGPKPPIEPPPPPTVTSRYYGRVTLDPQRVNKEVDLIVLEVIERLTSLVGCQVEITLEIAARRPEGFDDGTVRTVTENSRTLKFEQTAFETE